MVLPWEGQSPLGGGQKAKFPSSEKPSFSALSELVPQSPSLLCHPTLRSWWNLFSLQLSEATDTVCFQSLPVGIQALWGQSLVYPAHYWCVGCRCPVKTAEQMKWGRTRHGEETMQKRGESKRGGALTRLQHATPAATDVPSCWCAIFSFHRKQNTFILHYTTVFYAILPPSLACGLCAPGSAC